MAPDRAAPDIVARSRFAGSLALLAACVGVAIALNWFFAPAPPSGDPFRILRGNAPPGSHPARVTRDPLRSLYADPGGWFFLSSSNRSSLFVLATGVQILTDSGWRTVPSKLDHRGQIWRLAPGELQEFCVERPQFGATWRPYIRYGREMTGARLLYWRLRSAWTSRSISSWTGTAWGGGCYSGDHELVGETIEDWPE